MVRLINRIFDFILGGVLMIGSTISVMFFAWYAGMPEDGLYISITLGVIIGAIFIMVYTIVTEFPEDFDLITVDTVRAIAVLIAFVGALAIDTKIPYGPAKVFSILALFVSIYRIVSQGDKSKEVRDAGDC